nr:hypothetical protein [Deltaproteobacteria bacterium]
MRWLYPALFVVGLVVYGAVAGDRVWKQSGAPHFVFQADAWLHGRIAVEGPLPNDDWAQVETVALADGTVVKGRRMMTRPVFRTLAGAELPIREVR